MTLEWNDGRLSFPARAAVALELLCDHDEGLPISRLPHLDPDERMVVARRLLDEGPATTVDTPTSPSFDGRISHRAEPGAPIG